MIRSLFHSFVPLSLMTACLIMCGGGIVWRTGDPILLALLVAGLLASVARLVMAWTQGKKAAHPKLDLEGARRIERRFAVPYLAFAAILGLFGARAFMLPDAHVHMLTIGLLLGYCSGVAISMGLRLRIAAPAMTFALLPTCIMALFTPDLLYWMLGALLAGLLIGGVQHLFHRHELAAQTIGMRFALGKLARVDALTALPNRLALREWFDERIAADPESLIAVHYLDLNGFKPVNDEFGHPVGDELLAAVGKRIAHAIRDSDIAARLGGDEFAVVQFGLPGEGHAESLAGRLRDAIARPFRIGDLTIRISAGLGFVIANAEGSRDLDHLLGLADQALYASKRTGRVEQHGLVEGSTS